MPFDVTLAAVDGVPPRGQVQLFERDNSGFFHSISERVDLGTTSTAQFRTVTVTSNSLAADQYEVIARFFDSRGQTVDSNEVVQLVSRLPANLAFAEAYASQFPPASTFTPAFTKDTTAPVVVSAQGDCQMLDEDTVKLPHTGYCQISATTAFNDTYEAGSTSKQIRIRGGIPVVMAVACDPATLARRGRVVHRHADPGFPIQLRAGHRWDRHVLGRPPDARPCVTARARGRRCRRRDCNGRRPGQHA